MGRGRFARAFGAALTGELGTQHTDDVSDLGSPLFSPPDTPTPQPLYLPGPVSHTAVDAAPAPTTAYATAARAAPIILVCKPSWLYFISCRHALSTQSDQECTRPPPSGLLHYYGRAILPVWRLKLPPAQITIFVYYTLYPVLPALARHSSKPIPGRICRLNIIPSYTCRDQAQSPSLSKHHATTITASPGIYCQTGVAMIILVGYT